MFPVLEKRMCFPLASLASRGGGALWFIRTGTGKKEVGHHVYCQMQMIVEKGATTSSCVKGGANNDMDVRQDARYCNRESKTLMDFTFHLACPATGAIETSKRAATLAMTFILAETLL